MLIIDRRQKMDKGLQIFEHAIVAAGRNHNPTILNPDFLKRREIVPDSWKIERPICTDNLSQVVFENKFLIRVEPGKIDFIHPNPTELSERKLEEIAIAYVGALPEATYTAIGINFRGVVPFPSKEKAEEFVVEKMLSNGPWREINGGVQFANITLGYKIDGGNLNLTVQPAEFGPTDAPNPMPVNTVWANFHRDLPEEHNEAALKMVEIMSGWKTDQAYFEKAIDKLFSLEQ